MNNITNSFINVKKSFERVDKKKKRKLYYFSFTILFLFISFGVFSFYILNNKSFIWMGGAKDGLAQHLNCLVYYSNYLRSIVENIFVHQNFAIPQWDFAIGYGADILTTMSFVTIGDVLNLFSVFVPEDKIPLFFQFMAIFRLYLAGIVFSMFCFKLKQKPKYVIIGAFIYMFCGFAIFALPRHPFFINPMIYLPLILLGVEKIFQKENPYVFIFAISISLINNFYFFFTIIILAAIYVIIRFFTLHSSDYLKNFMLYMRKFVLYGLLGLMLASFMFLPVVFRFLSDLRGNSATSIDLFYSLSYYKKLISSFIGWQNPGFWSYLGYGPIVILSVFILFLKRNKLMGLKIAFLILTFFLMFPFFGHVFNGLSYVVNRWVFGYSFLIALVLVYTLPLLMHLKKTDMYFALLCSVLYFIVYANINDKLSKPIVLMFILLFVIITIFIILQYINLSENINSIIKIGCFHLLTYIGIFAVSYSCYSVNESNNTRDFLKLGQEMETLKKSNARSVANLKDTTPFYRYGEPSTGKTYFYNSGMNYGLSTPNYFFSFSNPFIQEYYADLQIGDGSVLFIPELDSRTILNTLASTKYYSISKSQENWVPFGYEKAKNENDRLFTNYENKYFLPLGYTYDSYIPTSTYKKLNTVDKQNALLQSIVLDEQPANLQENKNLKQESKQIHFEVKVGKNVEYKNGKYFVKKANSEIKFLIDSAENRELYITLKNMVVTPKSAVDYFDDKRKDKMSKKDVIAYKNWSAPTSSTITLKAEVEKAFVLRTFEDVYYNKDRTDYTLNLGYSKSKRNEVTLKFQQSGEYTFDDISFTELPMSTYANNVQKLNEDALESINIDNDKISGNLHLDKAKILCLSIPYTDGWKARVDGKEVELLRGNTMFMAIPMEKGDHYIELMYKTPGLKIGGLISIISIGILIIIYVHNETIKKKRLNIQK